MKYPDYIKPVCCFFCILFFLSVHEAVYAQCDDVRLSLTPTASTCLSNGTIKVTLSGNDLVNLRQSDMQFQVSGTQNHSWANYPDNTIPNLPEGTYTVSLRAFCSEYNGGVGGWIVASHTATTTVATTYSAMNAILGTPRKTLNCATTGMVPITIRPNTGSSPFTVTITDAPNTYGGSTSFSFTRGNAATTLVMEIDELPAGNYTFTVADACAYTQTIYATVGIMSQDYSTSMFSNSYVYPPRTIPNDCDLVSISRTTTSSWTADEAYYFYTAISKYFDMGVQLNGTGAITWVPTDSLALTRFNYRLPYGIKTFRANSDYLTIYMRIKGSNDPNCQHRIRNLSMRVPTPSYSYTNIECDSFTVRHSPYSDYDGVFCYPYRWRIVTDDGTTQVQGWSGWLSDRTQQTATKVPYGCKIEYEDSDGYIWYRTLYTSAPTLTASSNSTPCASNGMTDSLFHSYIYLYVSQGTIPAGTRIKYVAGSGPITPTYPDFTTTADHSQVYPFSPGGSYTVNQYTYIPTGTYQFEITLPGTGCVTRTITCNHSNYAIKTPFSYTTEETCGGLSVIPTGGQLRYLYSDGSFTDQSVYFYIGSVTPSSVPISTVAVALGDTLYFPASGRYILGMTYARTGTSGYCFAQADTFDYEKSLFELHPLVTTAHVCEDASLGFIRVGGIGGSGNYWYELYDKGNKVAENDSGVFAYGLADSTYRILLKDLDPNCAASYEQDVKLIDLGIAQIAYTSNATNTFCLVDSIYLKCITLGETTYKWTGPGITTANENLQNPAVAASDVGIGTHTYTVTVRPEGCGAVMIQSVTVTVEDCSGAQDDYVVMLVNTLDSIDVLANDKFPASCAASVIPVIITTPTKGTATVAADKRIVYEPQTGFIGQDSLKYGTTCGGVNTEAWVYIRVIPYPDNIIDAECHIDPPATEWSIKEVTMNRDVLIQNYGPLVVGDIDGDGIVEILGYKEDTRSTNDYESTGIKIFYYDQTTNRIELKSEFLFSTTSGPTSATFGSIAIARYNNTGYIVVAGTDKFLYAYSPSGARLWRSDVACHTNSYATILGIADFNNDGIPEVYTGDQIFSLSNGRLLCDGGRANASGTLLGRAGHSTIAVDMNGDGKLELVAGTNIYDITITNNTGTANNAISLLSGMQLPLASLPANAASDGATQVVDMDGDGKLEVVVVSLNSGRVVAYVWKPLPNNQSYVMGSYLAPATGSGFYSIPMLGNIDNDPNPEIVFISNGTYNAANYFRMYALKYNASASAGSQITLKWDLEHTDGSGCTGATLFDFNQDGQNEIVYRDQTDLRIIDGSGSAASVKATFNNVRSSTLREYPVIADIDDDGQAEIVVTGWDNVSNSINSVPASGQNGYLRMFKTNGSEWAPARKVWNQYAYNAVCVNEDLTIPRIQLNPEIIFPGPDGLLGTADDVQPYNNFLQQQTALNKSGTPIWLTPDVYPDPTLTSIAVIGDSVSITIGVVNEGDASIGPPVYVALYKESIAAGNFVISDSINEHILPGDTGYISIRIPNMKLLPPMLDMAIRVNDNGVQFMYQEECDNTDNVLVIRNPALSLLMEKKSVLTIKPANTPFAHNGSYPNPVSILNGEEIEYTITGVNVSLSQTQLVIRDTLPAYLHYVSGSATTGSGITVDSSFNELIGYTPRDILKWTISGVPYASDHSVSFKATPYEGVCASQPNFINRAWVTVDNDVHVPTNYTYHQGACIGIVTFSASLGGTIYNAEEQALDYMTSPRSGILVVPDEGYRFTGWSHDDYISLRGEPVAAVSGILLYDTLTIYGNVTLQAHFELEEYAVSYHLNGGDNDAGNPSVYTIESGAIELAAPTKANDVFVGWTGSNGDTPQVSVVIPQGTTGALEYYANFLYGGREDISDGKPGDPDNEIWAIDDVLYVRADKAGSVVRIYTVDGLLRKVQSLLSEGVTKIQLPRGIYIVTLNDGIGQKIRIE